MQVAQFSGESNAYGITLRYTRGVGHYDFILTTGGYWAFYVCDDAKQSCMALIPFAHSDALQEGIDTLNTLEARAVGSHFDFYLNGTKVGQANDSTYTSGQVALVGGPNMECVFSNLSIALPE